MQTFGLFLSLGTLGGKRGSIALFTYLFLGAIGLPVFSFFQGGLGALMGATGGYLSGFLVAALLYWRITACNPNSPALQLIAMGAGLLACYTFGTLWYAFGYLQSSAPASFALILTKCVLPYLLPDVLKLLLAWHISRRLQPFLHK